MAQPSLTIPVHGLDGRSTTTAKLAPSVFAVSVSPALISETLVSAQENRRHPIANTKTRGQVSGGGRKPWRQKGTGRARTGSTRGPQWRHGGVVFGPTNARSYARKINRKARQSVVRMLLTGLHQAGELRLVSGLSGEALSTTKQAAAFLNGAVGSARRPLLVTATADALLLRSLRNLGGVSVRSLERLGLLDLALTDQLVLDAAALDGLTARYAAQKSEVGDQDSDEQVPTSDLRPPTSKPSKRSPTKRPKSTSVKPVSREGGTNA